MALLERVSQMKQTGMADSIIVKTLQEEGNSYKDINDAFSQLSIKSAITAPMTNQGEEMQPSIMASSQEMSAMAPAQQIGGGYAQQYSQEGQTLGQVAYNQAVYNQANQGAYSPADYTQQPYRQEGQVQETQQYAEGQTQDTQAYAEGQAQGGQAYAEGYYPETYYQQAMDVETVREISRQVVEEELSKTRIEMEGIIKLKTELNFQVQNIDNRLARIESTMQELQTAILKRIGNYGEAITDISKELRATQDSFSKMVNPVMNLKRGTVSQQAPSVQQQAQKQRPQSQKQQSQQAKQSPQSARNQGNSNKPSFEDYFR